VVSRNLNEPGRYSCGHQDRMADLTVDGAISYWPADYPGLIPAPDVTGWLRADWTATGRELRRQFQDGPEPSPSFPINPVS
jgi:hypothetical protein